MKKDAAESSCRIKRGRAVRFIADLIEDADYFTPDSLTDPPGSNHELDLSK